MAKKTASQVGAEKAAATRARRNPLTGGEPNSFTSSTRPLPEPTKVRPFGAKQEALLKPKSQKAAAEMTPDEHASMAAENSARTSRNTASSRRFGAEASRLRDQHLEATKPGGTVDAQAGYQKPQGMESRHFSWLMGAHHMFPNESAQRGTAAINEPHEHHPDITVQRRAEDLSGPEYRKGAAVLAHYGHDPKDPMGSLKDTHERTLNRVIGEHAQAGVEESSSQIFYGGRVSTETPHQPEMEDHHYSTVTAAQSRLKQAHSTIANDPAFRAATPTLDPRARMSAAKSVVTQATSDTSPNNKWRDKDRWPNIEQGEEAVKAGIHGTTPKFIGGRIQNNDKAAGRTSEMLASGQFATHAYGDPKDAAKTVAFRGAMTDRDHTDSYKVSDVHEASVMAPGLGTSKSKAFSGGGSTSNTYIHPDHPASATKGLNPVMDVKTGTPKQKVGLSRPEEMLAKGDSYVHALNDHATRAVATQFGLSRSVNHSDNVHPLQAAAWGSQQMMRPDVNVSHADQYPVVRDWGHEGVNVPNHNDVLGALSRGEVHTNLGAQFAHNPNTNRAANTAKTKAYPITPGS